MSTPATPTFPAKKLRQVVQGYKDVLALGDPEWQARTQRLAHGITLPLTTRQRIQDLARELQISAV